MPPPKKTKIDGINGEGSVWKTVRASHESHDCVNPVRSCEEIYFKEALEKRDKSKELIKVSIGERERESESKSHVRVHISRHVLLQNKDLLLVVLAVHPVKAY